MTNMLVGPVTGGSDPWQLQYYDPSTCDIIEQAKQFSHCDVMSITAFPVCADFNVNAAEYIEEVIMEQWSWGLMVSKGQSSISQYMG